MWRVRDGQVEAPLERYRQPETQNAAREKIPRRIQHIFVVEAVGGVSVVHSENRPRSQAPGRWP